jgi:hypothetical protein
MKFNDHFFKPDLVPKNPPAAADNPFRCFKVHCVHCGDLRVILIAKFDQHRHEIVVVRRIASRKICECDSLEGPLARRR